MVQNIDKYNNYILCERSVFGQKRVSHVINIYIRTSDGHNKSSRGRPANQYFVLCNILPIPRALGEYTYPAVLSLSLCLVIHEGSKHTKHKPNKYLGIVEIGCPNHVCGLAQVKTAVVELKRPSTRSLATILSSIEVLHFRRLELHCVL